MKYVVAVFAGLIATAAHAASLEDLTWMEGRWDSQDGTISEWWMPPAGGTMAGAFRWAMAERTVLEFIIIEETAEGPIYRFKHFNPNYETWEADAPLIFELAEHAEGFAVFRAVDPPEGAPRHLVYRRAGETLFICVEGVARPAEGCGGFELELMRQGN